MSIVTFCTRCGYPNYFTKGKAGYLDFCRCWVTTYSSNAIKTEIIPDPFKRCEHKNCKWVSDGQDEVKYCPDCYETF